MQLFALVVACFLAASLCGWVAVLKRWARHEPLLERTPRAEVPWGLADLLVTLLLLGLTQAWAVQRVRSTIPIAPGLEFEDWDVSTRAALLFLTSIATLLTFLAAAVWLFLRYRVTAAEIGLPRRSILQDLVLGGTVFLLVAPPVFGLQSVLVLFFESRHPLLELLKEDPSPRFFLVSAFSAGLVAPLVEEFLFRVLLQSWLEQVVLQHDWVRLLVGGRQAVMGKPDPGIAEKSSDWGLTAAPPAVSRSGGLTDGMAMGPVVVTAAVFALLHWSHGPDPAALFLLALALGVVYSRTRRILPCVVAHALLNASSLVSLWFAVRYET